MQHRGLFELHWDTAKLLELGVDEEFVSKLSPEGARELLKGVLYLMERQKEREG